MRRRPLFDPALPFPLRLSRRSVELYLECPRCFYNEVRLGIKRPSIPAFTLNKTVDTLLKREFDRYRKARKTHPLFAQSAIDAIPYDGPEIDEWRSVQKGIRTFLSEQNIEVNGAPDEVLQLPDGSLAVVDFKATAKKPDKSGMELAGMYADSYIRQISFYTFLLKENDFAVAREGYLLIANAKTVSRRGFSATLSFMQHIVSIRIDMDWIIPCIDGMYSTASISSSPAPSSNCEHCFYAERWNYKNHADADKDSSNASTF
ncbi:MAG: PD-(D/E)XK nuclease family protein [Minisyncoccia bacterium]